MIPDKAVMLIVAHESNAVRPYVPLNSSSSGVTLGIGYDIAHHSPEEVRRDWGSHLLAEDLERLVRATSLVGQSALDYCQTELGGMLIRPEQGVEVFQRASLPKYERLTQRCYSTWEEVHPYCYGALVSLIFNRGPGLGVKGQSSWDTRREMREIQEAMQHREFDRVPDLIRSMKRLWEDKGLAGLLRRRDEEADLFENGLKEMR